MVKEAFARAAMWFFGSFIVGVFIYAAGDTSKSDSTTEAHAMVLVMAIIAAIIAALVFFYTWYTLLAEERERSYLSNQDVCDEERD